jgi:ketosteroid isomerase-like protein
MTADARVLALQRRRAESNQAIAARDAERVVACMMADVRVSVAHGPTLAGREASRIAFAEQFGDRHFEGYVRTPAGFAILDPPTGAIERGRWVGRWRRGIGVHEMRGTYVAEWSFTALGWFIQSEVFTPDAL